MLDQVVAAAYALAGECGLEDKVDLAWRTAEPPPAWTGAVLVKRHAQAVLIACLGIMVDAGLLSHSREYWANEEEPVT